MRVPEAEFERRLRVLHVTAYGDIRDALWAPILSMSMFANVEDIARGKIKRRAYLARYAPGVTIDELDRMTSAEVRTLVDEISFIIGQENGPERG